MFQFVILLKFWGHLHVILLVWTGLEIKKILRLSFGDQLEKYSHSMVRSIRFDCLIISETEVGINLEVNWFCLCDWHIFCDESKAT